MAGDGDGKAGLGRRPLMFHIQNPAEPLNIPIHSRALLAAILSQWL